jgi:hypothetical protein
VQLRLQLLKSDIFKLSNLTNFFPLSPHIFTNMDQSKFRNLKVQGFIVVLSIIKEPMFYLILLLLIIIIEKLKYHHHLFSHPLLIILYERLILHNFFYYVVNIKEVMMEFTPNY